MANGKIGLIRLLDAIDARRNPNYEEEKKEYDKALNLMRKYHNGLWGIDQAVKKIERGEV